MTDKEQIECKYKFQDKEKFDGKPYCTCFNELCEDLTFVCDHNCQIYEDYKQLARKTQECEQKDERIIELTKEALSLKQECEELEDFRTLVRELFAFGDSDVDDESFIKYLNEYVTDMTKLLDGCQILTDILEIDWTIHGPYDIEEIIKQVTELKREREELKVQLKNSENARNYAEKVCIDIELKKKIYKQALDEIEKELKEDIYPLIERKLSTLGDR